MILAFAAVAKQLLVVAARFFERIRQDGHPVEAVIFLDATKQTLDYLRSPVVLKWSEFPNHWSKRSARLSWNGIAHLLALG